MEVDYNRLQLVITIYLMVKMAKKKKLAKKVCNQNLKERGQTATYKSRRVN